LKNVRVSIASAENMPFRDAYFDLIVSNNGLNNVKNMKAAFAESFRVAKKGAPLIFTVNLYNTMVEFYVIFTSTLIAFGLIEESEKLGKYIMEKRKSVEEIVGIIVAAGFKVEKIDEEKFHMNFCDGTALLNHNFIKIAFLDDWKKILASRDVRRIFTYLEKKLNLYADQNGSLKLTIPFACFSCVKT
jgi:arsenite methyltransferase